MNRSNRRAAAAKQRRKAKRADLIGLAYECLAANDVPTLTGATLILPSGESLFVSIDDARALAGFGKAKGAA